MRGSKDSTSNTSEGGGAGGTATPVLLLSGGWTGIPSTIKGSYRSAANVLRMALVQGRPLPTDGHADLQPPSELLTW